MNPLRYATRLLALGVALSCLIAPRVGQAQSRFTAIDFPGAPNTTVTGINNLGQVVGSYPSGNLTKSFVWARGKFTKLAAPSGVVNSTANAINDLDLIVGLQVFSDFSQSGFVNELGFILPFNNPNAVFSLTFPRSVNDLFQVAGFYVDANSATDGFVYHNGVFTTVKVPVPGAITTAINSINNLEQVAGYYVTPQPDGSFATKAFVYSTSAFTPLSVPGATGFSVATGINDLGQVVGYYLGSDFVTHGFLYYKGRYTTIDAPIAGSQGTYPGGINDLGQISGEYVDSTSTTHGFFLTGAADCN